jgi:glycerol-3-phosphate acyltransferase PlsY
MLELGVKFLLSYFLGSVMGAMVMGRIRGGVDIRTMGSGNAGGTNALRTQGAAFALGVVLIDVGKGVIGAGVIPLLDLPFVGIDPGISRTWLALSCGAAAVSVPVWLAATRLPADQGLFIYSTVMAMFIIFWHRSNIQRMRRDEENRNERMMLFRRKERVTDNEQH